MAITLLYLYAVLSILIDLTISIINRKFSISIFVFPTIIFSVSIFLVFMISKGKAWPRNLLLIFFTLGVCSGLWLLPNIKVEFRYVFIISFIKYALGLIALTALFLKPSKQWFETFKKN